MTEAAAVLHVCTTCRTDLGARLHGRLARLLAERPDAPVRLLEAKCLSNCEHGCSAAIAMPGKWSYLLGGLDLDRAVDLLEYAAIYAGSKTGVVMPSKRPASLAAMVRGRIPPLELPCLESIPAMTLIPATIITGFLGAGKTTLLRHVLEHAGGRRIAIIVNEFGALGIDGETLRSCGIAGCDDDDIIELANGCICCTVAEDFLPTMERLLDRPRPPEHIVIETSGLALPKPLLRAFNWPTIRTRMTVDGVVTVVDAPAVAAGRFADDPEAVARARAADPSLDHDNPLSEVYEDQLLCADLVVLNKTDLLPDAACARLEHAIADRIPRAVKILRVSEGRVAPDLLLGLASGAEDDLDARPSHHEGADGLQIDHEHDDFESFVVPMGEIDTPERLVAILSQAAAAHDILRIKGFAAVRGKPMRLVVQGVGTRFRHSFDRPWNAGEARRGDIVVIGRNGLDRAAIESLIAGAAPAARHG